MNEPARNDPTPGDTPPDREQLASDYLDQLEFDPYPVQEEALLSWFSDTEGTLVCAPTGTGKTLIAEAAAFEALHTRQVVYYTTPLIALTEQKFAEMQEAAERWGFAPTDIGLVTGNRCVNPDARVLVVVAEILLNRLLHPEAFEFEDVSAVVMDEFHSFSNPERGMVWELALGLLPKHVRLLLLSATVGNSREFLHWLRRSHQRELELVEGDERRVPLTYFWIGDELLNEQLTRMAEGDDSERKTPALVFCFNREICWSVAEQLKGKQLLADGQQKRLAEELAERDFSTGVGSKLKQLLMRGVGVHHAGMLPKYRRMVEELFQRKLLSVAVCTETLAAGINLPARSVVLVSLVKGPPGKKKLVDPSSAHQMFGRAGRPQFDKEGFVYALAHEDDVKIARWREKYDAIPEDTKDPGLRKAKKALKKKMPKRRTNEQYWNQAQFEKLTSAPAGDLSSRGPLPWRLLAYLLEISPDVARLREVVHKRLMTPKRTEAAEKELHHMLKTLWAAGYVELEPEPPPPGEHVEPIAASKPALGLLGRPLEPQTTAADDRIEPYRPIQAQPTDKLEQLLAFRSVNPLYGAYLVEHLGIASPNECLQALESVLEIPSSVWHAVRVPSPEALPPGPLENEFLTPELIGRGLISSDEDEPDDDGRPRWPVPVAAKLRMLFDAEYPGVSQLRTHPVWVAGELLEFGGDFNKLVTSRGLAKQEGIVFRHLLRLVLLCDEFARLVPAGREASEWEREMRELGESLTRSCHGVDPESTDKFIAEAQGADVVEGEANTELTPPRPDRP